MKNSLARNDTSVEIIEQQRKAMLAKAKKSLSRRATKKKLHQDTDDDDAFRLCIMVTDGQPYYDGFDWKAVIRETCGSGNISAPGCIQERIRN